MNIKRSIVINLIIKSDQIVKNKLFQNGELRFFFFPYDGGSMAKGLCSLNLSLQVNFKQMTRTTQKDKTKKQNRF